MYFAHCDILQVNHVVAFTRTGSFLLQSSVPWFGYMAVLVLVDGCLGCFKIDFKNIIVIDGYVGSIVFPEYS